MELAFRKEGSKHIAEFSATADFNLHLEKEKEGFLFVQQRTSTSGQYDSINGGNFARMFGVILKAETDGILSIYPSNMVNNSIDSSIVAYGIMPNLPVSAPNTSAKNLKEYLDVSQPMLFTQTEITEEEFYNLNVEE